MSLERAAQWLHDETGGDFAVSEFVTDFESRFSNPDTELLYPDIAEVTEKRRRKGRNAIHKAIESNPRWNAASKHIADMPEGPEKDWTGLLLLLTIRDDPGIVNVLQTSYDEEKRLAE